MTAAAPRKVFGDRAAAVASKPITAPHEATAAVPPADEPVFTAGQQPQDVEADQPDVDAIDLADAKAAAGPMDMGTDLAPQRGAAHHPLRGIPSHQRDLAVALAPSAGGAYDADDGQTPDFLWVLDTTARAGHAHEKRTHHMTVDNRVIGYEFEPDKRTKVPFAVALKFIRHPEFLAYYGIDADAHEFGRVMDTQHGRRLAAGESFALGADEVVAKFTELRQDALLSRALQLPGGERFKKTAPARELAEFITNHIRTERMREQQALRRRERGPAAMGGGTMAVDDMDEDALERMFPKD